MHNYYGTNAFNFSYLLLEYYKDLGLNEEELAVILMINHLLEDNNDLITVDLLSLKMTLESKKIDKIMASLMIRKLIELEVSQGKAFISIKPLNNEIVKMFQSSIFSKQEIEEKEEMEEERERIFTLIEKEFGRTLSPIEISRIDLWIQQKVDEDIIINSIKDASMMGKKNIATIDRIIISKCKKEDRFGNAK